MFKLVVPEASPSQNRYHYSHWRKAHADKKRWGLMLLAAARNAGATAARGKRRLTVERHGKRALDFANLVGGLKGAIDCLVELGLLLDDDEASLDLVAKNVRLEKGTKPFTVLLLEDVACQLGDNSDVINGVDSTPSGAVCTETVFDYVQRKMRK